jgi:hypothetical protein
MLHTDASSLKILAHSDPAVTRLDEAVKSLHHPCMPCFFLSVPPLNEAVSASVLVSPCL